MYLQLYQIKKHLNINEEFHDDEQIAVLSVGLADEQMQMALNIGQLELQICLVSFFQIIN